MSQSKVSRQPDLGSVLQMVRRVRPALAKRRAERIERKLGLVPEWRLVPGRLSLDRELEFPDAATASSYAGFVNDFAARHGQPSQVVLRGAKLVIHLRSRRVAGAADPLTPELLEFARKLG
jgi:hypothetical protein